MGYFPAILKLSIPLLLISITFYPIIEGYQLKEDVTEAYLPGIEVGDLTEHVPIFIDSNSDFNSTNGIVSGKGISNDPWIIEGWKIDATKKEHCIYIGNTTDHFIVRDCVLLNATYYHVTSECVMLHNVTNGTVMNCEIFNGHKGIRSYLSSYIEIVGNDIHHHYYGIQLKNVDNFTIRENKVRNSTSIGITDSMSFDQLYEGNIIKNNNGRGIGAVFSTRCRILNNTVDMHSESIYIHGVKGNVISGNLVKNSSSGGILAAQSGETTISNNTLTGFSGTGIWINWGGDENLVEYNMIYGTFNKGIYINGCHSNIVKKNNVSGISGNGMEILSSSNRVFDNSIHDNSAMGMMIGGQFNKISNNSMISNYDGVSLRYNNNELFDNIIIDHDTGISVPSCSGNIIRSNYVDLCSRYGIFLYYEAKDNIFRENEIRNCTDHPVYLNGSGNIFFWNNFIGNRKNAYDDSDKNIWSSSYPEGGNYWSKYRGYDWKSGPNQDQTGYDGMGDIPHYLAGGKANDSYPSMSRFRYEDTDHPLITNIRAADITFNHTRIEWETQKPSDSNIRISLDPSMTDDWIVLNSSMAFYHYVDVYGLEPDTDYYYRVSSTDYLKRTTSDDNDGNMYSFRTETSYPPSFTDTVSGTPTTGDIFNLSATSSDDWGVEKIILSCGFDNGERTSRDMERTGSNHHMNIMIPEEARILDYQFHCRDIEGLHTTGEVLHVNIVDDDKPDMKINANSNGTTGDELTITVDAHDNWEVDHIDIAFKYEGEIEFVKSSMTWIEGEKWSYTKELSSSPEEMLLFKIYVHDGSGNWNSSEVLNVTLIDNDPPIADAGQNITIENGMRAYFNGTGCHDNDLVINYTWTFTYDNDIVSVFGKEPSFLFTFPGHYLATLVVMDHMGLTASDMLNITVVDTIPPFPLVCGRPYVMAGDILYLDAFNSTDNGKIASFEWNFFDEKPFVITGPVFSHEFITRGKINITLTVFDEWNLSTSINITVEIIDETDPVADPGVDMDAPLGRSIILNGSNSVDDGRIVKYIWVFSHMGQDIELNGMVVSFTFNEIGDYIVSLTVIDQSGNFNSRSLTVSVKDNGYLSGSVRSPDGKTISGAVIEVIGSDGNLYKAEVNSNGEFNLTVPMGDIQWTITATGYKTMEGLATISPLKTTTLDPSNTVLEKEEEKEDTMIFIIIVSILIVLVLIGIFIMIMVKGKKKDEHEVKKVEIERFDENQYKDDEGKMDETPSEFSNPPQPHEEEMTGSYVNELFEE